jgi:hypothetical protein
MDSTYNKFDKNFSWLVNFQRFGFDILINDFPAEKGQNIFKE